MIVPVKSLALAKSRLSPRLEGRRPQLALAFACDTVTAALGCPLVGTVFAVTADRVASLALSELGAVVVPDRETDGLNGALEAGAGEALRLVPGRRVAALTADLPSLRSEDLGDALAAAGSRPGRSFVPDAPGTGTVLLAAGLDGELRPLFGAGSRRAHEESGAAVIDAAGASLRRDVDTAEDLNGALLLGVGTHTQSALYAVGMQGTVRIFDPATRAGTVLLDDGTELAYDTAAFDAGGLRLARPGQRVALRVDDAGRVTALTLATLPLPG
ncbi:MAG TPA: 2-phospho-L-lactate guanylyltransferase [Actinocrinis sp.]